MYPPIITFPLVHVPESETPAAVLSSFPPFWESTRVVLVSLARLRVCLKAWRAESLLICFSGKLSGRSRAVKVSQRSRLQ